MVACKRIISSFLAVVICIFLCVPAALAAWYNDLAYIYTKSNLIQWATHGVVDFIGAKGGSAIGSVVIPGVGTVSGAVIGGGLAAAANDGIDALMDYLAQDSNFVSYDDYVSSLDNPVISFADTVFTPSFDFDASLSTNLKSLGCTSVVSTSNSVSFYTGNYTGKPTGGSARWNYNLVFSSLPFSVSQSGYYVLNSGAYYATANVFSGSYYTALELSSDGGSSWSRVVSFGSGKSVTGSGPPLVGVPATDKKVYLDAGNSYRLCVCASVYLSAPNSSDSNYYNHVNVGATITSYPYIYRSGQTVVPSSTRTAALMQTINQYNSYDYSTKYYIGTVDASSNVTNVYSPDIFNEQTMIFTEPVTGEQYQCTGWKYHYSSSVRGYRLDLAEDTFSYNGRDIRTVVLFYLNDVLLVLGLDQDYGDYLSDNSTVEEFFNNCTFYQTYNYVIAEEQVPEICQHVYTSETVTAPTCLDQGVRRYTCELCGHTRDEYIPATGHAWEVTETVETEFNENGDITKLGYTVYTCSVCGATYKTYDGTGQPGPPTSGNSASGSGDTSSGSSFFGKIKDALADGIAKIIDALSFVVSAAITTISSAVGDLLSSLMSFVTDTVLGGMKNFFASFTDGSLFHFFQVDTVQNEDGGETSTASLPEGIASVFALFSGIFLVLPSEIWYLLLFGVGALALISVLKFILA